VIVSHGIPHASLMDKSDVGESLGGGGRRGVCAAPRTVVQKLKENGIDHLALTVIASIRRASRQSPAAHCSFAPWRPQPLTSRGKRCPRHRGLRVVEAEDGVMVGWEGRLEGEEISHPPLLHRSVRCCSLSDVKTPRGRRCIFWI
jgi:hypothetical protein